MSFPVRPVAALMASLVSLCVGTSFARTLFPQMGAVGISAYRIGLAALLLLAVLQPWRQRWRMADLPALALYGVTLGTMNLLFYLAIGRIPLGLAIAIEFTGPLAVALWSSRRGLDWVWVTLASAGLGLILPLQGLPGALDAMGVSFALAAGVCWALYIVAGQHVARRHGRQATAMGMLVAALVVVPAGLLQSGPDLWRPQWLWPGLVVATLSSALPYALEMYALGHLPRRSFSILLSLEPAVGAVAGWIMLSQALQAQQWLAIACIMAASVGSAWGLGRAAQE